MLHGHREAQGMFEQLGRSLGFEVRRSFSQDLPTDGVWFLASAFPVVSKLPYVALEVVVSESPKSLRGSITTLEQVSPSLGVLLIQEDEIQRRLLRNDKLPLDAEAELGRLQAVAGRLIVASRQRIEVWSMSQLRAWCRLYAGERTGYDSV